MGPGVGVMVGVFVGNGLGVRVGVSVAVDVGVNVCVGVKVRVAVGVSVGKSPPLTGAALRSQLLSASITSKMIHAKNRFILNFDLIINDKNKSEELLHTLFTGFMIFNSKEEK